ncbi:MAG: hypothetical protein WC314_25650 [Vulcanimicrobiota bacterium]
MKKVVEIRCDHDCAPEVAVIEIDEQLADRIRFLAEKVKELDAFEITIFNASLKAFMADHEAEQQENAPPAYRQPANHDEELNCMTDCCILHVTASGFLWSACVKHSDVRWTTEKIYLDEIAA